jgi:Zn-dependent protease with chaperone function
MTLPYFAKLLCLCLASFFLIHLALASVVKLATPAALRIAARIRPVLAARYLFLLRILPAGFSVVIVAGLCVPSYLRLEPRTATSEEAGLLCLAFSILAVTLWMVSIARGLGAIIRSIRYLQGCKRSGQKTALPGERLPVWMVEEPAGLFAMAGITRPSLLISRQVMSALSGDHLAAALRHERAHWTSRDNRKRLILTLAPDILPFLGGFATLERGWARYTERAADDRAVGGDIGRSLSLATALVSVSRLGLAPIAASLVAPLLADDDDLPARVQRLLNGAPPAYIASERWMGCLLAGATVILSGTVIAIGLQPAVLFQVHRVLEHLIQ